MRNPWASTNKRARRFVTLSLLFVPTIIILLRIYTPSPSPSAIADSSDFDRFHIKYIYPEIIDYLSQNVKEESVDWSRFAYVFYATKSLHLCNAMMLIYQLRQFQSKAQFLLLLNSEVLDLQLQPGQYRRITKFASENNVKIKPITVTTREDGSYWESSFTKLEIFNQFDYDRLIYLDSDAILPKGNLDELFFLPPAKLATVTAYWLTKEKYKANEDVYNDSEKVIDAEDRKNNVNKVLQAVKEYETRLPIGNKGQDIAKQRRFYNTLYNSLPNYDTIEHLFFTSIVMVITPSQDISEKVKEAFMDRKEREFDMDILNNHVFRPGNVLVNQIKRKVENDVPDLLLIPHQIYGCLTSELNMELDHRAFLSDPQDQPYIHNESKKNPYYGTTSSNKKSSVWFQNVKYLHFSDSPIPKPWIWKNPQDDYMRFKMRCFDDPIFKDPTALKPKGFTEDCQAGEIWDFYQDEFAALRQSVCGLGLL